MNTDVSILSILTENERLRKQVAEMDQRYRQLQSNTGKRIRQLKVDNQLLRHEKDEWIAESHKMQRAILSSEKKLIDLAIMWDDLMKRYDASKTPSSDINMISPRYQPVSEFERIE